MPINAHFIQAAKPLAPGASYHADLVLPHIRDLAGIAQRVTVDSPGAVSISCEGQDGIGDTLADALSGWHLETEQYRGYVTAYARVPA